MKPRAIYYRRKEGKIICEGKEKGKTVFLFTIPDYEKLLNSSLFTEEKKAKILKKILRLDYKNERTPKEARKLPTSGIVRTFEEDEIDEDFKPGEEDIKGAREVLEDFEF